MENSFIASDGKVLSCKEELDLYEFVTKELKPFVEDYKTVVVSGKLEHHQDFIPDIEKILTSIHTIETEVEKRIN